ncbi:MAG: SDR family oxidoreductase [Abitibacteriaceae bacterium]|nr:SDR family oxidoreductase [Abditibacteriaceae bacterium]MBV9866903.1 SDR family oxidoreductase [Abditibacteriaceae bacterium]
MQPQLVLVTGGTGTLGSAIVQACRANSHRVVANYLHNNQRAEALQHNTGCELWRADVSDEAQVATMFAALPPLFAIVHSAAITHDALLVRQSRAAWAETLQVNADGAFLVTRMALQKLQDGGRLILLASRVGEHGNGGQGAYAASKAAVIALTKCAAREGAARRLGVNAICPGVVPSALTDALSEPHLRALQGQSVLGSFGTAQQVAATVAWLLSDAAAGISGQVIHCDSRI